MKTLKFLIKKIIFKRTSFANRFGQKNQIDLFLQNEKLN